MPDVIAADVLMGWDNDAQQLVDLVMDTPVDQLDVPVAGEWSPRQILAHMLDAEVVYGQRLRTALAQPGDPVSPFDQDAWARGLTYQDIPVDVIASALLSLRKLNTALLLAMPEGSWGKTIQHPERGLQKLSDIVPIFGNHFADHLTELEAAAGQRG